MDALANAQLPEPGKLTLDHVAHFVPDIDAASEELARLGFTVTPFSAQSHRLDADAPLVPAGTGNRCVMLKQGYLEILTPTADTPLADQLRAAIKRYVGVHLIAFGTSSPDLDHRRLTSARFEPYAPVALQRNIETPSGTDIARFSVVRVPPHTMPEGRIQYCQHHTPQLVWQPRWLEHQNRAEGLAGTLLCVEEPQQAAQRYARFTGIGAHVVSGCWRIDTTRGFLLFIGPEQCRRTFGLTAPVLPWIAGYALTSSDVAATHAHLRSARYDIDTLDRERLLVKLPAALGGIALFVSPASAPLICR
jgi:hypothetical protein